MTSLVVTLTETLRYRGAIGQWSWVLHRVTGLGVLLFLVLHVIDTSWSVFYPALYEKAIAIYQNPLFTIGEFALVACVVYHAINGIRIGVFDARPELWRYQARAAWMVLGLTVVVLVPTFAIMFAHVVNHYNTNPQQLSLLFVLQEQLPFAAGIAIAAVAAVLLSGIYGIIGGNRTDVRVGKGRGSRLERFWWSFMRISGLLILPLVFGHLAMTHLVQGVFELTIADHAVVGTTAGAAPTLFEGADGQQVDITNGINDTGTATEFVAERWNFLIAGVAFWRLYDIALLALVTVHGFNGLRYVLTDFTMSSPLFRRAAIYLCAMGAAALLVVGGAALLGTIQPDAIRIAEEARAVLYTEGG